jgi:muramoyltetrapeptide carboxypeptidase
MKKIYPNKLKKGDHIRVIAPARSLAIISGTDKKYAIGVLEDMGFKVSFGRHALEQNEFLSSSVQSRIDDLHEAYEDPSVNGILTVIGGYNSNQLLKNIDYDLIQKNPKILCGFSDITALSNAIYAKTGVAGYSGAHFSTFGMIKGIEYTKRKFIECLTSNEKFTMESSQEWSDDLWFLDQEKRDFNKNDGFWNINNISAKVSGDIIGGHLRCLNALQGTEFMPDITDCILFAEEDEEINAQLFDRQLQSILHLENACTFRAILIGRFQKNSNITRDVLEKIIKSKTELAQIPIIGNCDFGHTTPICTYPIGGKVEVDCTSNGTTKVTILEH